MNILWRREILWKVDLCGKWHVSGSNLQTVEELASRQGQPWNMGLAFFSSSFWIAVFSFEPSGIVSELHPPCSLSLLRCFNHRLFVHLLPPSCSLPPSLAAPALSFPLLQAPAYVGADP